MYTLYRLWRCHWPLPGQWFKVCYALKETLWSQLTSASLWHSNGSIHNNCQLHGANGNSSHKVCHPKKIWKSYGGVATEISSSMEYSSTEEAVLEDCWQSWLLPGLFPAVGSAHWVFSLSFQPSRAYLYQISLWILKFETFGNGFNKELKVGPLSITSGCGHILCYTMEGHATHRCFHCWNPLQLSANLNYRCNHAGHLPLFLSIFYNFERPYFAARCHQPGRDNLPAEGALLSAGRKLSLPKIQLGRYRK